MLESGASHRASQKCALTTHKAVLSSVTHGDPNPKSLFPKSEEATA